MKLTWEYIGEELAVFWESPYGSGKEKIASFWWPLHPPDKTTEVESVFESIASWACLYGALSTKSRCICNPIIPGAHAAMCPENFPPAEPSGNTGELPVCATCGDRRKVLVCHRCRVPENLQHRPSCDRQGIVSAQSTYLKDEIRCPDCSAAQPATEQPRIWRVMWQSGIAGSRYCESKPNADMAYNYAAYLRSRTAPANDIRVQYSTDNGKTWIDEQAEREGK